MKFSLYEIRNCKREEYDKLVTFLNDHWKANHIFCKSKEIFEFQHGKAENGFYDFVVAVHKETQEFHAVLGFIRSSLYDGEALETPKAIYGALWKVRDDVQNKEIGKLGLGVLFYLIKSFPESSYITLGLSKYSQAIYDALHYHFDVMNHYYIANAGMDKYEIIEAPQVCRIEKNTEFDIRRLKDIVDVQNAFLPNKTSEYIRNRYLRHPFYQYEVIGIYKRDRLLCEWIIRKIAVGNARCIRIVDMVGDIKEIDHISGNINSYLEEEHAEYIDCCNYGLDSEWFYKIGFIKKEGNTIVPNYFEPFERSNVEIHCANDGKKPVVIFKGDGDQDRPNVIA